MNIAKRCSLICVLAGLAVPALPAKAFATYQTGSMAAADVIATNAFDVIDPAATSALRAAEALKTPAIFRFCPVATNVLGGQLQIAFAAAHSDFTNSLQETFQKTVLDHAAITSPDFDYLVTAYNITHKKFPVPSVLAMDWAYGKTGETEKNRLFAPLLQATQLSIRPDDLPAGFSGGTWRLISVSNQNETLTPETTEARGQLISPTNFLTLSQAQMQFRRQFNNFDEQPLARALSTWLQPDCLPEMALTESVRARAVQQLVVSEHYAAGQIIVRQGSIIDEKTKAALDAAQGKPAAVVDDQPIAAAPLNPSSQIPATEIQIQKPAAVVTPAHPAEMLSPKKNWLAAGLIALAAIILITLWPLWRFISRRRSLVLTSPISKDLPWQTPSALQTELAPQLIRIVREAFVQELAGQRRDLLLSQRAAAEEVIRLVHRMDGLHVAMQERLQTYQEQIQKLETELAARTEENRDQIKLKIQMIRHQIEAESSAKRIELN
jgi:hypothetical protein